MTEESIDIFGALFQSELANELDIETNEELLPILNRKLYIDKTDRSVSDIQRLINERELNLQPSYQRNYIWQEDKASKFIESLLLGIPIPTIFWSENENNTFEVIDGQQRLTSLDKFLNNDLKLKSLETLFELNGKKYNELEEKFQRILKNASLPIVVLKTGSSEEIKYDVFRRINQGSIKLSNQDLRNVIYRGLLIDFISELSKITDYQDTLLSNFTRAKLNKEHEEMIIRFLSMDSLIVDKEFKIDSTYVGRMNDVMIKFLSENKNNQEILESIQASFIQAIENTLLVFGNKGFRNIKVYDNNEFEYSRTINKTVAELQMVVLSRFSYDQIEPYKELIKQSFEQLCISNPTIFSYSTGNRSNVITRYSWGKSVLKILSGENHG